jgi:hypothetical protein
MSAIRVIAGADDIAGEYGATSDLAGNSIRSIDVPDSNATAVRAIKGTRRSVLAETTNDQLEVESR